uniref:Uncharacterized protein n=1 Tax=Bursaphelenchus xylophilus TaxID=6326 RepID=A0A1I7S1U4_BURXY
MSTIVGIKGEVGAHFPSLCFRWWPREPRTTPWETRAPTWEPTAAADRAVAAVVATSARSTRSVARPAALPDLRAVVPAVAARHHSNVPTSPVTSAPSNLDRLTLHHDESPSFVLEINRCH